MVKFINNSIYFLSLIIASNVSAEVTKSYNEVLAEQAQKAHDLSLNKTNIEAESVKSKNEFLNTFYSKNGKQELPEENRNRDYSTQIWLQRTKGNNNYDLLSKEWGGHTFTNEFSDKTPYVDTNNTDFYKNGITTSGGTAYINNQQVPISDGVEFKPSRRVNMWISFSGQAKAYPRPSNSCDAIGYANTGDTGRLFVKATSAVNVLKDNSTSQIILIVNDLKGNKLASYQGKVKSSSYDSGQMKYFERSQYFMINQAGTTFNLAKANQMVQLCVQIINKGSQQDSFKTDNFHYSQRELDAVKDGAISWLDNQVSGGNKIFTKKQVEDAWISNYKLWNRALLNKYVDFMWIGL